MTAEGCGFPVGNYHTLLDNSVLWFIDSSIPFERLGHISLPAYSLDKTVTVYNLSAVCGFGGGIGEEGERQDFALW